jgi:protein-disulfide isomerase
MRCEEAQNNIAEYLRGTLSAESGLLEHLAQCHRCRDEVEELQKVWADLEEVAVPRSPSVMHASLVRAIAEAKLEPTQPHAPIRRNPMPLIKPILLIVFSVGAAFFMGRSLMRPLEPSVRLEQPTTPAAPTANDSQGHYRGASNAIVTLVEYGDYECPPCALYNSMLSEVLQRYGGRVRLEFRHFPLTGIHPNAFKAALAAEAAGQQGRYWEMHDLLLSSQRQWSKTDNPEQEFAKLATSIGLDATRLVEALASPELRQRVTADMTTGQQINIQAVPTFFLNGRRLERSPATAEGFFALVDAELQTGK